MTRNSNRTAALIVVAPFVLSFSAGAQVTGPPFAPGGRTLVSMTFVKEPLGSFPKDLQRREGAMEVVAFDGTQMLRASTRSMFLLRLPEVLPQDATMEFDLVPKMCCNPEDIAIEGTVSINQGKESANIQWHRDAQRIVGGGPLTYDEKMPGALSAATPGVLTNVAISLQGKTLRMYTNGQLLYTEQREFVRSRVIRVFLGGQNDTDQAVYLAGIRIAAGPPAVVARTVSPSSTGPNVTAPTAATAGTVPSGFTVTVTMSSAGPVVTWPSVPQATGYRTSRSKFDDLNCCNTSSGTRTYAATSPWQDQPLSVSGTYTYQVVANTPNGQMMAETQFVFRRPGGDPVATPAAPTTGTLPISTAAAPTTPIAGVAPPPPPPTGPIATAASPTTPIAGVAPPTVPVATAASPTTPVASTDPANPANPPTLPPNAGRYRITITGFATTKPTVDDPRNPDGVGDEVYVAAAVVLWDRTKVTVLSRNVTRTREYGDIGTGQYGTRIQEGTASATGGIWAGNGNEWVPKAFDPRGSSLPTPAVDQFPFLVWEGILTDGVEGLLVVPSIWESDGVPHSFTNYESNWRTSPITVLGTPTVQQQLSTTSITPAVTPQDQLLLLANAVTSLFTGGLVGQFGFVSALISSKLDRPIGLAPSGNATNYQDRLVVVTREKLAALSAGAGITIAIPFIEPADAFLQGLYTLYLRVERIP